MRIHTLGSVAGLVAVSTLSACVLPDDYKATLALADDSIEVEYAGDLVVGPAHGDFVSGRLVTAEDKVANRQAVEDLIHATFEGSGMELTSYEFDEGGRAHVEFGGDIYEAVSMRGRDGFEPIAGMQIRDSKVDGRNVYQLRFASVDEQIMQQFEEISVDASGEICIETELELADMSAGNWVEVSSGGFFSSGKSYCVDTTMEVRDEHQISFFRSEGNS